MLIHDKHEGWLITCDECKGSCFHCDYQLDWQADASDFDSLTVKLNTGETVDVEAGMFWLDGVELCEVIIDGIAAVLELVS
jgi:hypothetical protein